jgi:hypothetical protein
MRNFFLGDFTKLANIAGGKSLLTLYKIEGVHLHPLGYMWIRPDVGTSIIPFPLSISHILILY